MANKVDEFLLNLGNLDCNILYYRRDNIGIRPIELANSYANFYATKFQQYERMSPPFEGVDVGDVKCLSHAFLENITRNFLGNVGHDQLFRGIIEDGGIEREVTVKTWDFSFPQKTDKYLDYPRKLRDEIVLLALSERMKAHPFLPNLYGFCFDKKLAVVYDMEYNNNLLKRTMLSAEFVWEHRMKVATDFSLLRKTLIDKKFAVGCFMTADIMIDKGYTIKLVDFDVFAFPQSLEIYNSATDPDQAITIEKRALYELGHLLIGLVTKMECLIGDVDGPPDDFLASLLKKNSIVDESFEIHASTGIEITQLIHSCVQTKFVQRQCMGDIFEKLVKIIGYRPVVRHSSPWLQSSGKRPYSSMA